MSKQMFFKLKKTTKYQFYVKVCQISYSKNVADFSGPDEHVLLLI